MKHKQWKQIETGNESNRVAVNRSSSYCKCCIMFFVIQTNIELDSILFALTLIGRYNPVNVYCFCAPNDTYISVSLHCSVNLKPPDSHTYVFLLRKLAPRFHHPFWHILFVYVQLMVGLSSSLYYICLNTLHVLALGHTVA
jgi:hypothetical protein